MRTFRLEAGAEPSPEGGGLWTAHRAVVQLVLSYKGTMPGMAGLAGFGKLILHFSFALFSYINCH